VNVDFSTRTLPAACHGEKMEKQDERPTAEGEGEVTDGESQHRSKKLNTEAIREKEPEGSQRNTTNQARQGEGRTP